MPCQSLYCLSRLQLVHFPYLSILMLENMSLVLSVRDVTTRATGTTAVTPKFSDILTLFQPGVADSAHHGRSCTKNFLVDASLCFIVLNSQ